MSWFITGLNSFYLDETLKLKRDDLMFDYTQLAAEQIMQGLKKIRANHMASDFVDVKDHEVNFIKILRRFDHHQHGKNGVSFTYGLILVVYLKQQISHVCHSGG